MNRLLLVACLLFTSIASAGDYITVTGSGKTFEEAKQQAFRKAIEFSVGATVLSDVETQNYARIKDEIYIYSAGYVDDYKVLKQEPSTLGVTVLMEVSVSNSKLKNRILAVGKSGTNFEGDKHSSQVNTLIQERLAGDRLLIKLLNDYPKKAYNVSQAPYNITLDYYRNPILNIPYVLSWNFEYLKSMRETVSMTHDCEPSFFKKCVGAVIVMGKDPKDLFFGERTEHNFDNLNTIDLIHDYMINDKEPRILVTLKDMYNKPVATYCHTPWFISGYGTGFYSIGNRQYVMFYGNTKEENVIKIKLPLNMIDSINKIELSIESKNNCKN